MEISTGRWSTAAGAAARALVLAGVALAAGAWAGFQPSIDAVAIAVRVADAESDGVFVRGQMNVSVVNLAGARIRDVVLHLERPSPNAIGPEGIVVGDLDSEATGIGDAEVVIDQGFAESTESWVFRVAYRNTAGEPFDQIVVVGRSNGGVR